MSCLGLYCPGCSEGQSLGIAAVVALGLVVAVETVQWVAEQSWWIGSTVTVCFACPLPAGVWLERLADRRGARFAAAHGTYSRADVILRYPVRAAAVAAEPERSAIAAPQITVNIFGVPSPEQAAVIRQALPGHADTGDAEPAGLPVCSSLQALQ